MGLGLLMVTTASTSPGVSVDHFGSFTVNDSGENPASPIALVNLSSCSGVAP
ncbi:Uncharacterised protein [Mycobacteroides abscessus subsp. abscessus]|nr:Uncharacterised protein [Mycobacteroides abscessus subsp. abscessus]